MHTACAVAAPLPGIYTSRRIYSGLYFPFSARQEAAFNQPLSFDTSSVTGMMHMFRVRSARALRSTSN